MLSARIWDQSDILQSYRMTETSCWLIRIVSTSGKCRDFGRDCGRQNKAAYPQQCSQPEEVQVFGHDTLWDLSRPLKRRFFFINEDNQVFQTLSRDLSRPCSPERRSPITGNGRSRSWSWTPITSCKTRLGARWERSQISTCSPGNQGNIIELIAGSITPLTSPPLQSPTPMCTCRTTQRTWSRSKPSLWTSYVGCRWEQFYISFCFVFKNNVSKIRFRIFFFSCF